MSRYEIENNGGEIEIIAGEFNGIKGNASTFTPLHLYNARLKKGATVNFSFPEDYNTAMLVIEGNIKVNNSETAPTDHFVLMANDGKDFSVNAQDDAVVLVLSGEPINEPIAAHGPFVMNTRDELMQAFDDFNKGKFGYLEY